ncbi:uncharacterized protein FOMMEDRAFT_22835 [Fomitiporia mediterranea MF3/22]|uniref:uncharacterized protein n=1 Tax=Fomitiporia mediterranea (strain MF3/22) TaxID=694068 RepID=UPI000440774D|nr:uncharacterized protein FOMMEDRAFT_22835 [Fomitiporia mediterranea MF3/22]EJC99746.1 hypothetical protein FOMMEDRAFT_22835 [Fomitiporia mediterranea MF3/22]
MSDSYLYSHRRNYLDSVIAINEDGPGIHELEGWLIPSANQFSFRRCGVALPPDTKLIREL